MPCDHHVTILFCLFAYVECNFFGCEIKFDRLICYVGDRRLPIGSRCQQDGPGKDRPPRWHHTLPEDQGPERHPE